MINDGLFTRFPMERIFGYHNWPCLEAGTVAVHDSAVMAGGNRVEIVLDGHAGHAAMPHLARDPMLAAGHLLVALQSVVSRNLDPLQSALVSICTIEGGLVSSNQIPSRVTMRGTSRFFSDETRALVEAGVHRIADGIAAPFGMHATVNIPPGIGATVNSRAEAELAVVRACNEAGIAVRRDLPPAMTSEDFGWVPGRATRRLRLDRQWPSPSPAASCTMTAIISMTRSCPTRQASWLAWRSGHCAAGSRTISRRSSAASDDRPVFATIREAVLERTQAFSSTVR